MILRTWIVAAILLVLQACATQDAATTAAPEAGKGMLANAYTPRPDLSPKERFREVLYLLEEGAPMAARAELVIYLQHQPGSEVGRDLLRQIDLPSGEYFPAESRPVELRNGESLSTLSQQYLGSLYQFYALAKYNGIAEPRKITIGQTIEIPLTDEARQAFNTGDTQPALKSAAEPAPVAAKASEPEPAVVESDPEPEPVPELAVEPAVVPTTQEQNATEVEHLYREGLNAYRAQDLDKAIALWDQVLALDPGHENARLYRAQAIELKEKLSTLN